MFYAIPILLLLAVGLGAGLFFLAPAPAGSRLASLRSTPTTAASSPFAQPVASVGAAQSTPVPGPNATMVPSATSRPAVSPAVVVEVVTAPPAAGEADVPSDDVVAAVLDEDDAETHRADMRDDADSATSDGDEPSDAWAGEDWDEGLDVDPTPHLVPPVAAALAPRPPAPAFPVVAIRSPAGFSATHLRGAPTVEAPALRLLPNGTRVELLGQLVFADGFRWRRVRAPDGAVGWVVAVAAGG